MLVAVIGAAGFGGSHICRELITRGHAVKGISRSPETLGTHANYSAVSIDLGKASTEELVAAFKGVDALVNAYNPPMGPAVYRTFVEISRKILIAARLANVPYIVAVGGTGSLELGPKYPHLTAADSRDFWVAFGRGVADSECATQHMEARIGAGPRAEALRAYRNARIALKAGKASDNDRKAIDAAESPIRTSDEPIPDLPLAARATFLWYEGNETFKWSFVSPPGQYRPGPRTGSYEVVIDQVPLAPESQAAAADNDFEGRLLGATAADVAVAVVDEIEKPEKVWKHWSIVANLDDDSPAPSKVQF